MNCLNNINNLIGLYFTGKYVIAEYSNKIIVVDMLNMDNLTINNTTFIKSILPFLHHQAKCPWMGSGKAIDELIENFWNK